MVGGSRKCNNRSPDAIGDGDMANIGKISPNHVNRTFRAND